MSRPFGTSEEFERRRRRGVELLRLGERAAVIARYLGVDRSSVYRWRQHQERAPHGFAALPHPHRPRHLADDKLRELEALLRQGAVTHGWVNPLWTTARVAALIH